MILGLLRPVLILPSEGYSRGTLEAIFRHELVHFRRGDLWYKLLMTAVRAVHWYHPLVWWMVRVSDRDLELSCDEEAVRNGDLEARRQYSMALLDAVREGSLCRRSSITGKGNGSSDLPICWLPRRSRGAAR